MKGLIFKELRRHVPFTIFGALTGIVAMFLFRTLPYDTSHRVFYTLHPLHVLLSALVTASMYKNYKCSASGKKCNLAALIAVGYVGSIGIATLSDCIIPYLGELLLGLPNAKLHIGFIEEWWLVNPLAALGIAIAYYRPSTQFPHAGHVLISTWASLFHILMAGEQFITFLASAFIFLFLFFAVWLPCCISDIIFPLLFISKKDLEEGKFTHTGCCQ
ncbi:MAG: hypothetical protein P9L88_02150 [Candidatus Tantalella remota]|nr:hypothetical protein [Candidatus Tantalella remota]